MSGILEVGIHGKEEVMTWFTATLGAKGQITLPKRIRATIGAMTKGDMVGFVLDEKLGSVRLAKMEIRPAGESYSEADLRKLLKISKSEGGNDFRSPEEFLRHLHKL